MYRTTSGMLLIEMLVAILVGVFSIGMVLRSYSTLMLQYDLAQRKTSATEVARSFIDAAAAFGSVPKPQSYERRGTVYTCSCTSFDVNPALSRFIGIYVTVSWYDRLGSCQLLTFTSAIRRLYGETTNT